MGFITNLPLTSMISLGVICLIILITFVILLYTSPKDTNTRAGYNSLVSFSLYTILPIGLGFFLLAFMYWTAITQSAKNVMAAASKGKGPPKVPKVSPRK